MAAAVVEELPATPARTTHDAIGNDADVFADESKSNQPRHHRFSSHFDIDTTELGNTSSPAQVKRAIEVHLQETDRRLLDAQKLGNSLLRQREDLTNKLLEVEKHQHEAEIPEDLRKRLVDIEREHNDVGREVARALLAPKQRAEETPGLDPSVFASHASSSPTKASAPSRKQRNQSSTRAGDLQFAADISTSLLAQVRQLQAAVSERDDTIRKHLTERERLEQETLGYTHRLRSLDESEQRYKDENWNLETRNHELMDAAQVAAEREKKLNVSLSSALVDKTRLQNDLDEVRLAHGKLVEEHTTVRKAHDTEIHALKRDVDAADSERQSLQSKIDELIAQNQELAKAVASKYRGQQSDYETSFEEPIEGGTRDDASPDHSPPPSPTKGTPRHGGLESETLKSSLHHAHRMIQNLKGNIHREKTERIELKRMLQEARDELERRRGSEGGSASKRQKTKPEAFKKPARPDMLGGTRSARTDIEMNDDEWEDHSPSHAGTLRAATAPSAAKQQVTDMSDTYQTANETEGAFETADEHHTTESEAFMTGAESLAGDSTDELTETEETVPRSNRSGTVRATLPTIASKQAGDRSSWLSTASTSADEDEVNPSMQTSFAKFRLKNTRQSYGRQSREPQFDTPDSARSQSIAQDSPSTVTGRSPPAGEQSLFAELGDMDDGSSTIHSTPARSSLASQQSTPGLAFTPSKSTGIPIEHSKPAMVDSAMMTEPWTPVAKSSIPSLAPSPIYGKSNYGLAEYDGRAPSPSDFPLPPSVPTSPIRRMDTSTQYTPHRGTFETPGRKGTNFITPPKMVWDEIPESNTPEEDIPATRSPGISQRQLGFSGLLSQDTAPRSPSQPEPAILPSFGYSAILSQTTEPIAPAPLTMATPVEKAQSEEISSPRTTEESSKIQKTAAGAAATGILASAAAAFGLSKKRGTETPEIMEDETSEPVNKSRTVVDVATSPLKDISGNSVTSKVTNDQKEQAAAFVANDQASQTMLTAAQIDEALRSKRIPPAPIAVSPDSGTGATRTPVSPTRYPGRSPSRSKDVAPASATMQRPSSALSGRSITQQHPPLPPNHKDVIARVSNETASPSKHDSTALKAGAVMGPPIMPASAMRRPKTPTESVKSPTKDGRASMASRHQRDRSTVTSQMSHRSSVSSFASELDERFNIQADQPAGTHGFEAAPGTDPRMIQAITQTMIGEFLWKYTRKAGSKEMSNTRHRRYFWVHPYTKTLYWSEHDPQTAGRNELKAKSVAIESVRVLSDENPLPPGLHQKSIEVTTPGRKVRFTAPTGQRHETWFNALSYLLLRHEGTNTIPVYIGGDDEITHDDLNEFSVGGYGAQLVAKERRMSMSTYNSRTTRGTSMNRASGTVRQSLPSGVVATSTPSRQDTRSSITRPTSVPPATDRSGRTSRAEQPREADRTPSARPGSVSRLSRMLGSVTGRTRLETPIEPGRSENTSIYNASVVSDHRESVEEARQEQLKLQTHEYGGLENVRACCDGKHDVSTLTHRHENPSSHTHRLSQAINRSMSRRI